MYRTKDPTPKSKQAPIKVQKIAIVERPLLVKLTFISGLKSIVLEEIAKHPEIVIVEANEDRIYIDLPKDFKNILSLKSILNAYIVKQDEKLNPYYLSNHKSILGGLIDMVLKLGNKEVSKFKTFKVRCAGSDSKEVIEIQDYINKTYKLSGNEDADLEIYISKPSEIWEVSVRVTSRPLSLRNYRVANIKGGLNPTVAYAMNTFCNLSLDSVQSYPTQSYLNIFSGSGTLLIEAGMETRKLDHKLKLVGFDINGKTNALAIQNIKKADLIKQIHLKTADIFTKPDLGKFDIITSDLPFGMQISKNEDLEKLYQTFVNYSEEFINEEGVLVVYTTEYKILDKILETSKFKIIKTLDLVIPTSVGSYIYPRIFVCKLG